MVDVDVNVVFIDADLNGMVMMTMNTLLNRPTSSTVTMVVNMLTSTLTTMVDVDVDVDGNKNDMAIDS